MKLDANFDIRIERDEKAWNVISDSLGLFGRGWSEHDAVQDFLISFRAIREVYAKTEYVALTFEGKQKKRLFEKARLTVLP